MGRSVCLAPELPYIDSSRQIWTDIDNHMTSKPANQTLETTQATVLHHQIPVQDDLSPLYIPCSPFKRLSMSEKGLGRVHGMINLALVQRQRRDFTGPRSPLLPLSLTGE